MSQEVLLIFAMLLLGAVGYGPDPYPTCLEDMFLGQDSPSREHQAVMSVISVDILALEVFRSCCDLMKFSPEESEPSNRMLGQKRARKKNEDRLQAKKRFLCEVAGCDLPATFSRAVGESTKLVACHKHRRLDDMDSRHRLCQQPGCSIQASYGDIFQDRPVFCSAHKNSSHVHLHGKHCTYPSCVRWASYADGKGSEPTRCARHRYSHQVDVRNRKCAFGNFSCSKQPSYGLPNVGTAVHCALHRQEDEIDLKNQLYRCQYPFGCQRRASYGNPFNGEVAFCRLHRDVTHLNIRYGVCAVCKRQANLIDVRTWVSGQVKRYCEDHKTEMSLSLREIMKFSAHQDSFLEFQQNCSRVEPGSNDLTKAIAVQVLRMKQLARTLDGDRKGMTSPRQQGKRLRRR